MLETVLAKIGLPGLIDIIGNAIGKIDHPAAQSAAKALGELDEALADGVISTEQMAEANRHAEAMAELAMKERQAGISEVNQSLRAEVASDDPYVRRMRPTFGYLMAVTWAAQMFGLAYVLVFETDKAALVLQGMSSLSTIWVVGLSVLGIYVYKRSEDKKLAGDTYFQEKSTNIVPRGTTMSSVTMMEPSYNE